MVSAFDILIELITITYEEKVLIMNRDRVKKVIETYRRSKIQSEAEVRSKFIVPLLEALGYDPEYRAEEFPVYGFNGRSKLPMKSADYILFDDIEFADHRDNKRQSKEWVKEHSLLVVEAKKPNKIPDELEQAEFYTVWTKAVGYIETDGEVFIARFFDPVSRDYDILTLSVDELGEADRLELLSFESIRTSKRENTIAAIIENNKPQYELIMRDEDLNIPPEAIKYYRSLLGRNANNLSDVEVMAKFLNMTDTFLQNDIRYDIPQYMINIPRFVCKGHLYVDS